MIQSPSFTPSASSDRYSIQQPLEQHPGQSLYLAQDQLNGDTCIVQKLTAPSDVQATVVAQHLQNEASAFLNWNHPQFEQVRDCFVKGSIVILVKDEITGQSCADLLKQEGSFSENRLRPILESALTALAKLHRRSLSHGNISLTTLLLRSQDNQPMLAQFRFVRDVLAELGVEAAQPNLVEQAQSLTGQPAPTGAGEDLYALALTSMMLLTGQELAALYDPQAQTWQWEEHQLVTDSLSQALGRMLSGNVGDRFTSADEFLQALRHVESVAPDPMPPSSFEDSHAAMAPTTMAPSAMPNTQVATPPVSSTAQVAGAAIQQQYQRNRGLTIAVGAGIAGLLSLLAFFTLRGEPQPKVVIPPEYGNQSVASNAKVNNTSSTSTSSISTIQTTQTQTGSATDQEFSRSQAIPKQPAPTATQLSEDEAVGLIKNWLNAKRSIFASPFDSQLAASLTTGKLYYDITKPGGSIDWLRENGSYYKFGTQNVTSTGQFSVAGDRASIQVKITEDRTLYIRGRVDRSQTGFQTSTLRYDLFLENGTWKIEDYE